jgi:hypothetical protein
MRTFEQTRYGCAHCRRHYATRTAAERHERECLRDPAAPQPGDLIVAEVPALRRHYGGEDAPFVYCDDRLPPDRLYAVVIEHVRRGGLPRLRVWPSARTTSRVRPTEDPPGNARVVHVLRSQVVEVLWQVPLCPECGDPYGLPPSEAAPSACAREGFHPAEAFPEPEMPL